MNCIVVEDQLPAQRIMKKYISDIGSLNLVGCYSDAIEALEVLKSVDVDIMFLDVHLPKISGMDFLKTLVNPPQVILTTAFQNYAIESYEYNVVDYLLKPFSFQRFVKAVSKVKIAPATDGEQISKDNAKSTDETFVKVGYDFIKVKFVDVVFILSDSNYTELYLTENKILSSESLRYWEGVLPKENFVRVHKSYLINSLKITKVSGNQVFLEGGRVVPIGRAYKSDFMNSFLNQS